jgi:hypothetical protein
MTKTKNKKREKMKQGEEGRGNQPAAQGQEYVAFSHQRVQL